MIYEFKVTLKDVGIPVWRNIQVDGSATFHDLHQVLQLAFEWDSYHLHSFMVNKSNGKRMENVEIKPEDDEDEDFAAFFGDLYETYNEHEAVLSDWFVQAKDKVEYTYDFGDDWKHDVVLVKKIKPEKDATYPRCTGARNLSPDEDSRGEVIRGEVDLEFTDTKQLLAKINEEMQAEMGKPFSGEGADSVDYWEDALLKAKEFHKLKPWEKMADDEIFVVVDPVTEERLFCSVLGVAEETFGLAVYIGEEGYSVLIDILNGAQPTFDLVLNQRSLLLSFEDREDLEKEDYELVKTYDVPFRGRKAWPHFRSFKPGMYLWVLDGEEARLMLVVLEQAIDMYKQMIAGLEIPDMYIEEKVFAKVPRKEENGNTFENEILDLENYSLHEPEVPPLAISELELKRITKPKRILAGTIEFSMVHVDMPVQEEPGDRPVFPLLVIGADQTEGIVIYQNLLHDSNDIGLMQSELLKMLQTIEGIPKNIRMDPKTATIMTPLINKLNLHVNVQPVLPVVQDVVEEFHNTFT